MVTNTLDALRTSAFEEKMGDILNHGALALMLSIGHRTGLFERMSKLPPATSPEIALAAELNERYVREWLGAMVAGGIVEFNAHDQTYNLPPEHAAYLTTNASAPNLAVTAQFVAILGSVEDKLVECFRQGGGIPHAEYHRFDPVLTEECNQSMLPLLLEEILPLAEGLVERLREGIDVLDVGCAAGRVANLMAQTFPKSRFTGYEMSEENAAAATAAAAELGLNNVRYECVDPARIEHQGAFDFILLYEIFPSQTDPGRVLRNVYNALREGGVYIMRDVRACSDLDGNLEHPLGPFFYTLSAMHCMSVSLSNHGAGLGVMWGEELAVESLKEAGFSEVSVREIEGDVLNQCYVARKD